MTKGKWQEFWFTHSECKHVELLNEGDEDENWCTHVIEHAAYTELQAAYNKRTDEARALQELCADAKVEIEKLKKIIAQCPNENDDLGSEFVHVMILKEENKKLRAAGLELCEALATIHNLGSNKFDKTIDMQMVAEQALNNYEKFKAGDK